ncbi:MAG: ferrous iron transporter B [Oscillospiraceae bacterium]
MKYTIALVGNPNCGKTTLFNNLTGSNQYVGNWAGVTVEKKEGYMKWHDCEINIVDLPGIYSLSPYTMEEIITRDFIIDHHPNAIINIIDGTNIERNLYLSLQLMELGRPMVIAVNMMDDVKAKGDSIDCKELSDRLGVPVVPITARKGDNLPELMDVEEHIARYSDNPYAEGAKKEKIPYHHHHENFTAHIVYDNNTRNALNDIISTLLEADIPDAMHINFYAGKLLEGDTSIAEKLSIPDATMAEIEKIICAYEASRENGEREWMLADARYRFITTIIKIAVHKNLKQGAMSTSDKIDAIVTHRIFAVPVFLLMMLAMFTLTFGTVGNTMKGWIELFMSWFGGTADTFLIACGAPVWTNSLIVDAIIGGVGGILSFMPQIMLLFLCLS